MDKDFNYKYYLLKYPDLRHLSESQAYEHYITHGLKEGRIASC